MNIKFELLSEAVTLISEAIAEIIMSKLETLDINADSIADTTAISILSEIQQIVQNDDMSDFYAMEAIVRIFEKYHINAGIRHDF